MSLPSRERGLKSTFLQLGLWINCVAPLAGAWIEISVSRPTGKVANSVAPLAGAWIEIMPHF